MSGGVAYVLDLVDGRVNQELVELSELDDEAAETVRSLLARHAEETGSPVARAAVDDWSAWRCRFQQVMPREYRLVLQARAAAERDGLDEDATTAAMMGALHG
jgi:glutamate synthase (NADPH/NADH) large chain